MGKVGFASWPSFFREESSRFSYSWVKNTFSREFHRQASDSDDRGISLFRCGGDHLLQSQLITFLQGTMFCAPSGRITSRKSTRVPCSQFIACQPQFHDINFVCFTLNENVARFSDSASPKQCHNTAGDLGRTAPCSNQHLKFDLGWNCRLLFGEAVRAWSASLAISAQYLFRALKKEPIILKGRRISITTWPG
jgi:hypothetical protein